MLDYRKKNNLALDDQEDGLTEEIEEEKEVDEEKYLEDEEGEIAE